MGTTELAILYAALLATMLACRCLPLFVLRGRALPPRLRRALELIPAAAFAALVANDLLEPSLFVESPVTGTLTLASAAVVVVVARKTGSLVWSAVAGLVAYAIMVLPTVTLF